VIQTNDRILIGAIGRRGSYELPAGRHLLGIVGDAVVSSDVAETGAESTIYLTSRRDGSSLAPPAKVPGQAFVGASAGDHVLATGIAADGQGDPGVISISAIDGSITEIIPASPQVGTGLPFGRNIAVSPSAKYAVSSACTPGGCSGGWIIDVDNGTVIRRIDAEAGASALDDEVVLMRFGGEVTTEIGGYSIQTGKELWRRSGGEFYNAYFTGDGRLVVAMSSSGEQRPFRVTTQDSKTGESQGFVAFDTDRERTLWPELSTDRLAVLGEGGAFPGTLQGTAFVAATIDVATGEVHENAIRVDIGSRP
jgi:hypothetical protein